MFAGIIEGLAPMDERLEQMEELVVSHFSSLGC